METACVNAPRFSPGMIVATAGVQALIESSSFQPLPYLLRHLNGDWGDICPEDWEENQSALELGNRLLSVYHVAPELTLWIITEWDRSVTTMLLPDEY
ncbi:hypothetical protein AO268_11470 [Pseudomonas sp. ICMP 8385]|uniref:hypothetical protein n=1 Tax=Pseudomonas sp. ICMP 8385 TaxID=1718920 RepID=UPI000C076905|nr:hypothetical protein [Pseudomonas sp. ICMP 8385]PHN53589.1 hypothetical protein AO268_11470 [Pseudomonas sp. ICMP 8385]